MKTPLSYATCIVVRSAKMARDMTPHVAGGTICYWPGAATMGLRFELIINTLHPEEIINDPRIRAWFEASLRTRLVPHGKLVNDYLNYSPTKPGTVFSAPEPDPNESP